MGYETITDAKFGFEDFQENPSGIAEKAYLIPVSWLLVEAKTTTGTTAKSLVEIATAHTLKAAKSVIEVTPIFDKSGAKSDAAGQMLSKMFKPSAKFFMPQVSADNLGSATALKNCRFIIIIERPSLGGTEYLQIGTSKLPAYVMNIGVDLGEGVDGAVGITLELGVSASVVPFYVYKGVIPVTGV